MEIEVTWRNIPDWLDSHMEKFGEEFETLSLIAHIFNVAPGFDWASTKKNIDHIVMVDHGHELDHSAAQVVGLLLFCLEIRGS